MGPALAHIAGVPVEEILLPLSSVGITALAAAVFGRIRSRLERWRRSG